MAEELASQNSTKDTVNILIYSDDATTRREILTAVGRRPAKGLPEVSWKETATQAAALTAVRDGKFDLLILDAETPKLGGMGLGKMVHDEIDPNMPFINLIGRPQDEWLSRWSGAVATVSYPIDSRELAEVVASVLTSRTKA